ncbi:MAG TPA: helix-turn-helix domain-containing protein [Actinomycetaceae bacterium]|nr:helix-turn-helix domain-containing protein [Actinomycetaceae bacterium]
MEQRFLDLAGVAEWLAISGSQARAMVLSGELPAIQVGGRNQWRVEIAELEAYIQRKYAENEARLAAESESAGTTPRGAGGRK